VPLRPHPPPPPRPPRPRAQLAILAALSVVGLLAVAVPFADAVALTHSQNAAASGDLVTAYADSLTAERIEPYAVAPRLQEALVLEAAHDLTAAAAAARIATQDATTDWQAWLTLARIDAKRGAVSQALVAFERAEALDPRNTLWQGQT
jgi:cytochrome c-type biogenesis protein CcmH/NrfG